MIGSPELEVTGRHPRRRARPGHARRRLAALSSSDAARAPAASASVAVVETAHDVLVIGAGCAGMRAAIEAFDAGSDVALLSKLHPTRSHSGAAEGGINAALGNASEDTPEMHAFDTVKGSDYLADQDAVEILCAEAPGDVYQLENWGAVFSRTDDGRIAQRPFGAAGAPAHGLRRRHHRPRADPGALRAGRQARDPRLRGVLRLEARRGRRPLRRRDRVGPAPRRARGDPARARRSSRPAAPAGSTSARRTPTRAPATGWRWRSRRGRAEGHGDDAVPSDDARARPAC